MKDLDIVLQNMRAIEQLIEERQLGVDVKEATVTLTASLFSLLGRDRQNRPDKYGFIHFLEYIRAFINLRRGYNIGASGKVVEKGDTSGLLLNTDTLKGYIVGPASKPIIAFIHKNGSLQMETLE